MALTDRYVTSTGTDTYANSTSILTPMSLTTAIANAVAGDRINIKVGTYSRSANDTITNAGTTTSPIIWRGYNTTIGDGYLNRTNGSPAGGALITTNMPTIAYASTFSLLFSVFNIVECIQFTSIISGGGVNAVNGNLFRASTFTNSSTGASASAISLGSAVGTTMINCDATLTGASGGSAAIAITSGSCRIIGNRIKGGPAIGIRNNTANGSVILFNTIYSSGSYHIACTGTSGSLAVMFNTLVGGSSDAINIITSNTTLHTIFGNLITDNTGNGINMVSTANAAVTAYNRLRGNSNAYANAGDWLTVTEYGDITSGIINDYNNSGSNDYSLVVNSSAKGAGFPTYIDIGGSQRQEVNGSSYTF